MTRGRGLRPGDRERQLGAGDGPLEQEIAAEPDQLGRTTSGLRRDVAGILDQSLLVDQSAKILLVELPSGERLNGALERQQREPLRHQLEDDGAVFDLGPQSCNAGGQDAAMVVHHRHPRQWIDHPSATLCLGDQPGLIEKLVALQREFLVPGTARQAKSDLDAVLAVAPCRAVAGPFRPPTQARCDDPRHQGRRAGAPILPRQEPVPALPAWIALSGRVLLPGQPEIADRNQPFPGTVTGAIAVREGIELLDIAKRMMGLALDPGPQADLEGAMTRLE